MPPLFAGGILLTNGTRPPGSTLAGGGGTLLISIVTAFPAGAIGAPSTEKAATTNQPRTATATPRRALRRIPPAAMSRPTSTSTPGTLPYWGATPSRCFNDDV